MHYRKIGFIISVFLFTLVPLHGFSQENLAGATPSRNAEQEGMQPLGDFKTIDSTSYQLFMDKHWHELVYYGETALRSGVDYYYLRVRVGLAYFELKHYRSAIAHFKKALTFNASDEYAQSYLYYSYIYSGRYEEAKRLTKSFSPALAQSMRSKDFSAIDFINIESGFKQPDSSRLYDNAFFLNAGLGHSVNRRIFLFHNFSYYSQNEARFDVNQLQYYLRATLPLKNDLTLAGGFHVIDIYADQSAYLTTAVTRTYQVYGGPGVVPSVQTQTIATIYTETFTLKQFINYVGSFSLTKHTVFCDVSVGATAASFDTISQFQVNGGLTLYPFRNNRLSLGSNVYYHREKTLSGLAWTPFISAYLTPRIFLSAAYFSNTGPNVTEANGYFISNSVDFTTGRATLTASVKLNSLIWVYATGGQEKKKRLDSAFLYNYYIFVLGLKIIPQFK